MPRTLRYLRTSCFFARYCLAMSAAVPSATGRPAVSVESHCSVVAEVKSSAEDVVEDLIDGDATEKKIALHPFVPQRYRHEELWLLIFQVDDDQNLLRAVHELGMTCWSLKDWKSTSTVQR